MIFWMILMNVDNDDDDEKRESDRPCDWGPLARWAHRRKAPGTPPLTAKPPLRRRKISFVSVGSWFNRNIVGRHII